MTSNELMIYLRCTMQFQKSIKLFNRRYANCAKCSWVSQTIIKSWIVNHHPPRSGCIRPRHGLVIEIRIDRFHLFKNMTWHSVMSKFFDDLGLLGAQTILLKQEIDAKSLVWLSFCGGQSRATFVLDSCPAVLPSTRLGCDRCFWLISLRPWQCSC